MHWVKQDVLPHCYCVSWSCERLESVEPDKRTGRTVHSQISHEVTQLLDIKSQWGGVGGWRGWESINLQDVFLSVMITLLVPSFRRGTSNYTDFASYQGKDKCLCHCSTSLRPCACVCLWWIIHSQVLLSELSTAVQEGDPLRLSVLSPDTQVIPQLQCRCGLSLRSKGKTWQGNYSGDAAATQREKSYVVVPQNELKHILRESHKISWNHIITCCMPLVSCHVSQVMNPKPKIQYVK